MVLCTPSHTDHMLPIITVKADVCPPGARDRLLFVGVFFILKGCFSIAHLSKSIFD